MYIFQAKSIKVSPDPSRNKPRRHENGTKVSACANRSLAFSKLPEACFPIEAIKKGGDESSVHIFRRRASKGETIGCKVKIISLAIFLLPIISINNFE